MNYLNFQSIANRYSYDLKKENRFVQYKDLESFIKYSSDIGLLHSIIGYSEEGRRIYRFELGTGERKVLIWSQMHGNESTGTMACFDLLNIASKSQSLFVYNLLNSTTIFIIPMLNPDGAELWTRENARGIDLNRDALKLEAKESKALRLSLDEIQPDFCFNLHDQRSIFNVSGTFNPAILSFLSPSVDEGRSLTDIRKRSMQVICDINRKMQIIIPNCIGRYSDEYNPNASGDAFQTMGIPTILFEAGWPPLDSQKQKVRRYFLYSMILGLKSIANFQLQKDIVLKYNSIPKNDKKLFDTIIRNLNCIINDDKNDGKEEKVDIGIQRESVLEKGRWKHLWRVKKIGELSAYRGYNEVDYKGKFIELSIREEDIFPYKNILEQ